MWGGSRAFHWRVAGPGNDSDEPAQATIDAFTRGGIPGPGKDEWLARNEWLARARMSLPGATTRPWWEPEGPRYAAHCCGGLDTVRRRDSLPVLRRAAAAAAEDDAQASFGAYKLCIVASLHGARAAGTAQSGAEQPAAAAARRPSPACARCQTWGGTRGRSVWVARVIQGRWGAIVTRRPHCPMQRRGQAATLIVAAATAAHTPSTCAV